MQAVGKHVDDEAALPGNRRLSDFTTPWRSRLESLPALFRINR